MRDLGFDRDDFVDFLQRRGRFTAPVVPQQETGSGEVGKRADALCHLVSRTNMRYCGQTATEQAGLNGGTLPAARSGAVRLLVPSVHSQSPALRRVACGSAPSRLNACAHGGRACACAGSRGASPASAPRAAVHQRCAQATRSADNRQRVAEGTSFALLQRQLDEQNALTLCTLWRCVRRVRMCQARARGCAQGWRTSSNPSGR